MYQISTDLRLSEHFVLREFVRSATAQRLHIDNTPQACHVARLIALCEHVLEPLRREFGPLVINSGYRCTALNRAVGGVPHSQHLRGHGTARHPASHRRHAALHLLRTDARRHTLRPAAFGQQAGHVQPLPMAATHTALAPQGVAEGVR